MRLRSTLSHIALTALLVLAPIEAFAADQSGQEEVTGQTDDTAAESWSPFLTDLSDAEPVGPRQVISTALMGILQLLVVSIFLLECGLFTSWLAGQKGYNKWTWLALGFFFTLLALLAMVGAPVREHKGEDTQG